MGTFLKPLMEKISSISSFFTHEIGSIGSRREDKALK